jgi:hypothetical protein
MPKQILVKGDRESDCGPVSVSVRSNLRRVNVHSKRAAERAGGRARLSGPRPTLAELASELGVGHDRCRDYLEHPPEDLTPWVRRKIREWREAGGDLQDASGPRWTASRQWARRATGTDRR